MIAPTMTFRRKYGASFFIVKHLVITAGMALGRCVLCIFADLIPSTCLQRIDKDGLGR